MGNHANDVIEGKRFEFGDNWLEFLKVINEDRICHAERSLKEMLSVTDLIGKRFLDVGSGSGLFSLAARRLGATIHSFDYDPKSVACTRELKRRFFAGDSEWLVEEGSVLDQDYLGKLGQFDVVYSWGVLHHTGAMRKALENIEPLVALGGRLFIAIYNDQGRQSVRWRKLKKAYCSVPALLKYFILYICFVRLWGPTTIRDILEGKPGYTWSNYGKDTDRGMNPWRDVVDWVGGYPFEVAKPEDIFNFYRVKGFRLDRLKTCAGGKGCNEFVFVREGWN